MWRRDAAYTWMLEREPSKRKTRLTRVGLEDMCGGKRDVGHVKMGELVKRICERIDIAWTWVEKTCQLYQVAGEWNCQTEDK